jgi:hypothetical protein
VAGLSETEVRRAVRLEDEDAVLDLTVKGAAAEERARRMLESHVNPQYGDLRNRAGASDAMLEGRRVFLVRDDGVGAPGDWALSTHVIEDVA